MQRFEAEPRATVPTDFHAWAAELMLFADAEGATAAVGILMHYAPLECFRALAANQVLWSALIARGRYADQKRFEMGVAIGLGSGLAG